MKTSLTAVAVAVAFAASAGMASAATYEYDFKAASEPSGIGESAWTSFDTTTYFSGPGLTVTAEDTLSDGQDYVYFDAGNAGIGVCGDVNNLDKVNTITESGSNLCAPSSDDGLTKTTEILTFTAQDAMIVDAIYLNSNHDSGSIMDTVWEVIVNGVDTLTFDMNDFVAASLSGTGDIMISLGFTLEEQGYFTLRGTQGPNSYVSGLGVSAVPLPAGGLLLLAGLGGLAAMRRKRA